MIPASWYDGATPVDPLRGDSRKDNNMEEQLGAISDDPEVVAQGDGLTELPLEGGADEPDLGDAGVNLNN